MGHKTRELKSEEDLLLILNQMLAAHKDCAGCRFNAIYRHQPDKIECNWTPGPLHPGGSEVKPCLPVMGLLVAEAREKYNLK
jgi:hypothetical protein